MWIIKKRFSQYKGVFMKKTSKYIFMALGIVTFVLGTIGTVLPFLPTVPFYMAALCFFSKSSDRLHNWFIGTRLYKKHLEAFVDNKEMTLKTKLSIICSVTAVMAVGFVFMSNVPAARIILVIVWILTMLLKID